MSIAQEISQNPKEVFNRNGNKLLAVNELVACSQNGKGNFRGRMSRVQSDYKYSTYYFDVSKQTFDFDYSNMSNVARSHLAGFIKRGNDVAVYACAGGSNGVWWVINIKLLK